MLIGAFLFFLIFSFLLIFLLLRPKASEKKIERRLDVISVGRKGRDEEEIVPLPVRPRSKLSDRVGKLFERSHFAEDLRLLLAHTGSQETIGSVLITSLLIAGVFGIASHVMINLLPIDLVAVLAGGASRWALLKFKKSRRLKQFNVALPDAIELMARALRAGHSMSSAIEIVAEQSAKPLASEFEIVFQQQKFGIPFRDAILQLGDRVPSKDLHFLITAILVQKETGGDLTEILDRTTHVIRERVRIEGEIRTYTAQGRLTGWILSLLPVIMLTLINIVTPGYSHILFHDPLGQELLYAGGALILVGGFFISRIVDIQV